MPTAPKPHNAAFEIEIVSKPARAFQAASKRGRAWQLLVNKTATTVGEFVTQAVAIGANRTYLSWYIKQGLCKLVVPGTLANVVSAVSDSVAVASASEPTSEEVSEGTTYGIQNIIDEGCFLEREELKRILQRWPSKKNLILQGPPGTGKTWLAKRLGYALIGSKNREAIGTQLRIVQFHPSLAYEDFVRGLRPGNDKTLSLVDGIFMRTINDALSEPDKDFVLVIEEINRGNPAQIFGEMLTLLENSKRDESEGVELAYPKPGERVHIPANLYIIGTMNVADRSLAIVDLALRRRFSFIDLKPSLGLEWRQWCLKRGLSDRLLDQIKSRIEALNDEIATAVSLGPQFRIGHSFVTPDNEIVSDGEAWFLDRVEMDIGPTLRDEYWYDAPEKANNECAKLVVKFV